MMLTMAKTKLKALRGELQPKVAQEDMAHAAGLRVSTYRNVEYGRNTSYTTAMAVLKALNELRSKQGLSPVALDDLGLSIV
jgi:DNA-binding XRE family transcriptional regulator